MLFRSVVEMRHQRHAHRLGDFQRHLERRRSGIAAGRSSDAHLDADDQIAVRLRDARALDQVEQAQILALADHHGPAEGEDAGEGDVQIGEHPHRGGLDDEASEAVEGPRPGARSEEHTSELQSLMRISYAVFCLKKKTTTTNTTVYT